MERSDLNSAVEFIESRLLSHVYGFSSSNKDVSLPALSSKRNPNKTILCIFATNALLENALRNAKKEDLTISLKYDETKGLVFLNSREGRKACIKISSKWEEANIGAIFCIGFEDPTPDAYLISALHTKYYLPANVPIIYTTISPYFWIPNVPSFHCETSKIEIVFEPRGCNDLARVPKPFLYMGTNSHYSGQTADYDNPYTVAYFTGKTDKGKNATQQSMYLLANRLSSGKVVICMPRSKFETLPKRKHFTVDFRKAAADIILHKLEGLLEFLPEKERKEVNKSITILKAYPRETLRMVSQSPLGFQSSLFLVRWLEVSKPTKEIDEKDEKAVNRREIRKRSNEYLGACVAGLIDIIPKYGELKEEMLGTDDLETLLNLWSEIMLATNNRAYRIDSKTHSNYKFLVTWCNTNNLSSEVVYSLCEKIAKALKYLAGKESSEIYGKIAWANPNRVVINKIRKALSEVIPFVSIAKLQISPLLTRHHWKVKPKGEIIPLLARGDTVYIYIERIDQPKVKLLKIDDDL